MRPGVDSGSRPGRPRRLRSGDHQCRSSRLAPGKKETQMLVSALLERLLTEQRSLKDALLSAPADASLTSVSMQLELSEPRAAFSIFLIGGLVEIPWARLSRTIMEMSFGQFEEGLRTPPSPTFKEPTSALLAQVQTYLFLWEGLLWRLSQVRPESRNGVVLSLSLHCYQGEKSSERSILRLCFAARSLTSTSS